MWRQMWLIFLVFGALASGQSQRGGLCQGETIAVAPQRFEGVLAVSQAQFSSNGYTASADLELKNLSTKGIKDILVLIEFDTPSGAKMTFPWHGVPSDWEGAEPYGLKLENRPLIKEIRSGSMVHFGGLIPQIVTECPILAKITLVNIKFSDESTFERRGEWQTAALPKRLNVPTVPQEFTRISETVVKTGIDSQGIVTINEIQSQSEELSQWLKDVIPKWTFAPAIRNGKAEASNQIWVINFVKYHDSIVSPESRDVRFRGVFSRVSIYIGVPNQSHPVVDFGSSAYFTDDNAGTDSKANRVE